MGRCRERRGRTRARRVAARSGCGVVDACPRPRRRRAAVSRSPAPVTSCAARSPRRASASRLLLRTGEPSAVALRAIDLELSRAALALDDLARDGTEDSDEPTLAGAPVDIPQLLEDCVEAARAGARACGVQLGFQWSGPERAAWGDRTRLAQAARNLIANAVEHGGGDVMVRGRGEGGIVRIEVTDSGRGLPAPVAELIRRPRGGRGAHGRGLAIAAGIAKRHGGRLAAAPSDRGARLVLELPSAADPGRALGIGD